MKKIILLSINLLFLIFENQAQTIIDIDGNVYNTITIGTQIWMKENLEVIHYNNGDSIINITDNTQWMNDSLGSYCNYNNSVDTANIYGKLYNWFTVVDNRNLCPTGWHVPSIAEWNTLSLYLGGGSVAGGEMKETDTLHWHSPNVGATNISGFTGLPGGLRSTYGFFANLGDWGFWWSTSASICSGLPAGGQYSLHNITDNLGSAWQFATVGGSVRCICDSTASAIHEIKNNDLIKIYPDPATSQITIACPENKNLNLAIYNIVGELVLQRELFNNTNEIDIRSLAKGIYVIKVSGADWAVQRKLIKE
jgi:uncharacterized protein (TIGR02145 family)